MPVSNDASGPNPGDGTRSSSCVAASAFPKGHDMVGTAVATVLPRYVEVETSRRCNRTCSWCPNAEHTARRSQELMDWHLFRRVVDELGGLEFNGFMAFHNYNEPLLNRRILDEISYVRDTAPGARPAIYSNGDVLDHALFTK